MTEHELRDKIVDVIIANEHKDEKNIRGETIKRYLRIADALITAGIGDVSEWKQRAEVAERAFDKATDLAYEYRTEADSLSCSSCPMLHIFDSCKERGLYKNCSKRWKEELLRQAEKELQEERKDD